MVVRIEMDMPKYCRKCPLCERVSDYHGLCKVLPIKDLDGDIVDNQRVWFRKSNGKSEYCPLKECE